MKLSKRKKAIIFFGFYLIFFLVVFSFINQNKKTIDIKKDETKEEIKEEKILSLNDVTKMDYQYEYEMNIDGNVTIFKGFKDQIDYEENEYQYFFDIYNVNQLIKKSKVLEKNNHYGKYRLENLELDELLDSSESVGNTIIEVKEAKELEIDIDLKEYYQKNVFTIKLIYREVEEVE